MMFQTFLTMISMANSIHTDEQIRKNIENEANRFQVDPFPLGLSCTVESSIQRAENYFLETCPLSYDPICDDPIFNKYQEFEYRCRFPVWSNTVLQINSSNFMDLIKMRDYYGRDWCMVVLFHSPSCPFSSRLAAHFNEIPKKFQNLISVAVDASDFTKSHRLNFRYGVSGTPTVLLWVNGIGVARMGIKDLSLESIKDLITSHTDLQEIREKNDETREDNIPERLFELGAKLEDVSVDVKENTIMNILYVLLCILVCTITFIYHVRERILLSAPVLQWFQSKCGGPLCEDIYFLFYVAAPRTRAPPPPPAPEAPDADVPEEQAPEAPEVPENQNPAEDVVELPPLIIED
ncbi:hypothetical protein L5515_010645 [Caenorhabditis briggsae]|uniref:Thioredoxin domain-containing protein n=1 Tax=Caenorhabditis briggsae TaxID=6238 RepID=A0AAE9D5W9_CAEBR|nr:hypothetical protein L3Y34_003492 [Caenorhabditis briggsae]UMM27286.1 hypothetical protein L5515_010645 [Caenorhabditis briggsae]